MNQTQALEVVRSLANGVDPDTGEVFSAESPYQRPQTVRALFVAARRSSARAHRDGAAADAAEDRRAVERGRRPQAARRVRRRARAAGAAAEHERTMGAVRARLLKYGRMKA